MASKTQLAVGGASAATASAAVGTGVVLGTGGKGEKIEVEDLNDTIEKNEEDKVDEVVKEPAEKDKNPRQTTETKEITKKPTNPRFPGKPATLEGIAIDDNNLQPEVIKSTVDSQGSYPKKSLAEPDNNALALVSAKHTGNEWWWDLAFTEKFSKYNNKKEKLHTVYKNVTKAFEEITTPDNSEESPSSLNKACHEAYKKTAEPFYQEYGLYDQTHLFCTLGKDGSSINRPNVDKPKDAVVVVKNVSSYSQTYENKLAVWGSNEDNLASGSDSKNKNWWIWKYKNDFWYQGQSDELDSIFLQVWKPYSENKEEEGKQVGLNQACEEAYLKAEEITDTKLQNNIKDYCAKDSDEEITINFKPDAQ